MLYEVVLKYNTYIIFMHAPRYRLSFISLTLWAVKCSHNKGVINSDILNEMKRNLIFLKSFVKLWTKLNCPSIILLSSRKLKNKMYFRLKNIMILSSKNKGNEKKKVTMIFSWLWK